MTDHAPAAQSAPLPATRPPDPEFDRLARAGRWLAAAETGAKSPDALGMAAALRLYFADALGLPPFAASELSMVAGRLVVSAQLLRALARRAGYQVQRLTESDEAVTASVVEIASGKELGRATFTMEDARRAGLVKERGGWATYPRRMLWARASTYAVRDTLPDVALGLATEDEADEIAGVVAAPYDPTVAPLDRTEEAAAEAQWREATEAAEADPREEADTVAAAADAQATHRAHVRLALLIDKLEGEGIAPPPGHLTWTDFSRWVAQDAFGVESRADLNAAQLEQVMDNLEHAGGLPS